MEKPQLFIFHFAGGSSYSFQFLTSFLDNFDVISLELPGRGARAKETLLKTFELAALDIFNQIVSRLSMGKFALYGHSMGAMIAYRVCQMLEETGRYPQVVVVSGNSGPESIKPKNRYSLNDFELLEELKKLGGIPNEFYENKELLDFYLPVLRADFEIVEKKPDLLRTKVQSPIYAIMGNSEDGASEINNWQNFTTSKFESCLLEGGHFFLFNHPQRIAEILTKACG